MCKELRNIRIYMLYNIFLGGTMDDENGTMDDKNGTMVKKKWCHGKCKNFFWGGFLANEN